MDAEATDPVVESLAAKLADLDLTSDEARLLAGVLQPAEPEVQGFAYDMHPNDLSLKLGPTDLSDMIQRRIHDVGGASWGSMGTDRFRC